MEPHYQIHFRVIIRVPFFAGFLPLCREYSQYILSIVANLNSVIIWLVLIIPLIINLFTRPLGIITRVSITIGIIVIFIKCNSYFRLDTNIGILAILSHFFKRGFEIFAQTSCRISEGKTRKEIMLKSNYLYSLNYWCIFLWMYCIFLWMHVKTSHVCVYPGAMKTLTKWLLDLSFINILFTCLNISQVQVVFIIHLHLLNYTLIYLFVIYTT